MKAPDKIFVPTRFGLVDALRVRENDTDKEYIRKDALLEWAKGEIILGNSAEGKGWNYALQTLIYKINSM